MTDVTATIADLEAQRRAAFIAADATALGRLMSDQLILTHTTGMAEGKTSFIASLQGGLRFTSIEAVSEVIAVYGEAAVVSGELRVGVQTPAGAALALRTRITSVWAREAGEWRLTRYQATRIAE